MSKNGDASLVAKKFQVLERARKNRCHFQELDYGGSSDCGWEDEVGYERITFMFVKSWSSPFSSFFLRIFQNFRKLRHFERSVGWRGRDHVFF